MRPWGLELLGVRRDCLWRLHKMGQLDRIRRGLYAVPEADATEHHSLTAVCKCVPGAVVLGRRES